VAIHCSPDAMIGAYNEGSFYLCDPVEAS
jgi:hypothetical protein